MPASFPASDARTMPLSAAILAGGMGTRLRPVLSDRPKVLAPAAGQPFLDYVLHYLSTQGIHKVVLCVGYLASQVAAFAADGSRWNLQIHYSQEDIPLGTAGALKLALGSLQGSFFALNGDTLFTANLHELWQAHLAAGAWGTLALRQVPDASGRGCVTLDSAGMIVSFDEKPERDVESSHPLLINSGVYLLTPRALEDLPDDRVISLEREVFPRLSAQGKLAGCIQSGYFIDIGTPDSLAAFERDVRSGIISREPPGDSRAPTI